MEKKLQTLKNILDSSRYTVALCGSGILKECGYPGILSLDVAYDIENRYGDSPEYIYSSAYFSTRPEKFFKFYKSEILDKDLEPSETFYALAELEKLILSILVYTFFSRMFDLMLPPVAKHSIVVA